MSLIINPYIFEEGGATAPATSMALVEVGSSSIIGTIITPKGIYISNDGTKIFAQESGSADEVFRYDMSTPFDITTETLTNFKAGLVGASVPLGCYFKADGTKFFSISSGVLRQADLSVAWDTSTQGTVTSYTFIDTTASNWFKFTPNGLTCYKKGLGNTVLVCPISVAWDITTITSETVRNCPTSLPRFDDISFANSGYNLILLDVVLGNIELIGLTTAYDLSTMTDITDTFASTPLQTITISETDDSNIYILDSGATKNLKQLSLSLT